MPQLKTQGRGLPSVPDVPDGPKIFREMTWESDVDWTSVHLIPLLVYLKGNSSLNLPEKWQAVFPRHIWHAPEDLPSNISNAILYSLILSPKNNGHKGDIFAQNMPLKQWLASGRDRNWFLSMDIDNLILDFKDYVEDYHRLSPHFTMFYIFFPKFKRATFSPEIKPVRTRSNPIWTFLGRSDPFEGAKNATFWAFQPVPVPVRTRSDPYPFKMRSNGVQMAFIFRSLPVR